MTRRPGGRSHDTEPDLHAEPHRILFTVCLGCPRQGPQTHRSDLRSGARTVAVIIDPEAGINLHDPNANQTAQCDVETGLQTWGRFEVVLSPQSADLIIVVRKGLGKLAAETTKDPRQDSRPGSVINSPGAISIGAQHGQPTPNSSHQPGSYPGGPVSTQPQMEIGRVNDSFAVYDGDTTGNPTDSSPAWRWDRKNGLHAHDVPAVDEFRKALAEAEKQAAAQQSKHP